MPTRAKLVRLRAQLSAHHQALTALAAATIRLHRTIDGIVAAIQPGGIKAAKQVRATKGPRRKRSGDFLTRPKSPRRPDAVSPAALERHWGNLF
jgi:hypothetical protein